MGVAGVDDRSETNHDGPLSGEDETQNDSVSRDWLTIKAYGRFVRLKADDIDWIEAANDWALLHAGTESYLVRQALVSLQIALDAPRLVDIRQQPLRSEFPLEWKFSCRRVRFQG